MNKIILNVKVNYLPQELIESCVDCKNNKVNCEKILHVRIVSGDKGYVSIRAKYIPTTSYSFSIEIDFGREPIGLFTAEVKIARSVAYQYFTGIDTSQRLRVDVNPAFMSKYTGPASGGSQNAKSSGNGNGDLLE